MDNPQKPQTPEQGDPVSGQASLTPMISAVQYNANAAKDVRRMRERLGDMGDDWASEFFLINPVRIIEEAREHPMQAAQMCCQACRLLIDGHHARIREYIVAAYAIACKFRGNERLIEELAREVSDARSPRGVKPERVQDNLLHYVFIYIFHQSGMATRNRATQYAQALQIYFDDGEALSNVANHLNMYGQDRLRRAAIEVGAFRAALDFRKQGKVPGAATMNAVLAKMAEEEREAKASDPKIEVTDYGPRALPPSERDNHDFDEDTDWPNSELFEDDLGDDGDEADEENDEVGQPPEVDLFFKSALRLSAQLVAGLYNEKMDSVKRDKLLALVMQLATEIAAFRALVA